MEGASASRGARATHPPGMFQRPAAHPQPPKTIAEGDLGKRKGWPCLSLKSMLSKAKSKWRSLSPPTRLPGGASHQGPAPVSRCFPHNPPKAQKDTPTGSQKRDQRAL